MPEKPFDPGIPTDDPRGVLVVCLLCGEHVRYETRRGETRMRYATHSVPLTRALCENSGQPINAEAKK